MLTDDKVGAGPRLRPQALNKGTEKDSESTSKDANDATQPMETDTNEGPAPAPPGTSVVNTGGLSLSAKLAAKRKATTDLADSAAKAKR